MELPPRSCLLNALLALDDSALCDMVTVAQGRREGGGGGGGAWEERVSGEGGDEMSEGIARAGPGRRNEENGQGQR